MGLSLEVNDEVLIDASASSTFDKSPMTTSLWGVGGGIGMHIDEEGRPKFAPAKARVHSHLHCGNVLALTL